VVQNRPAAASLANEALKLSNSTDVESNAGAALAMAGDDKKALSLADDISRRRPNDTIAQFVSVPMIRSIVELQHGNTAKAMDLLDTTAVYARANDGVYYIRGLASLKGGQAANAAQEFQKVAALSSFAGPDVIVSAAHLGLARAYAIQNDSVRARIAYQDFLALWKDADPDVPLLNQAKAEYEKIK
jgi:tetratricopeptide (TPR) repeat protein